MDMGIEGKQALVCGASAGLGLACATALAQEGAHVVMVARGADRLHAAAELLSRQAAGVQITPIVADVTTAQGREAMFASGKAFDIVVTNAGGPPPGDFRQWDEAAWLAALRANMLTPIELIKATVDGMIERRWGRIVNITSSAVKAPIDILGLSNGARSGLTGFVAGLSRSVVQHGVTINNLLPGIFDTDRLASNFASVAAKSGKTPEQVRQTRIAEHPARRLGQPDEFGRTCAFLCSQHAGYINGQNILMDGGSYPGTF